MKTGLSNPFNMYNAAIRVGSVLGCIVDVEFLHVKVCVRLAPK